MRRSTRIFGARRTRFTGHAEYILDGMTELELLPAWAHTAIRWFIPGHPLIEAIADVQDTGLCARVANALAERLFWLTRAHPSWPDMIASSEKNDLSTLRDIIREASTNLAHARLGKRKRGYAEDFSEMTDDEVVDFAYTGIAIPKLASRMCMTSLMRRAVSSVRGVPTILPVEYDRLPRSPLPDPLDACTGNLIAERRGKRFAKRSLATASRIVGSDVAKKLASGAEVEIARGEFAYRATVRPTSMGHGSMSLSATDHDGRHLARLCFYLDETPGIDQAVAVAMMVKNGMEEDLIKTANLFDRDGGENPLVERQLALRPRTARIVHDPVWMIGGLDPKNMVTDAERESFQGTATALIHRRIEDVSSAWTYQLPRIPEIPRSQRRQRAETRLVDVGVDAILDGLQPR